MWLLLNLLHWHFNDVLLHLFRLLSALCYGDLASGSFLKDGDSRQHHFLLCHAGMLVLRSFRAKYIGVVLL